MPTPGCPWGAGWSVHGALTRQQFSIPGLSVISAPRPKAIWCSGQHFYTRLLHWRGNLYSGYFFIYLLKFTLPHTRSPSQLLANLFNVTELRWTHIDQNVTSPGDLHRLISRLESWCKWFRPDTALRPLPQTFASWGSSEPLLPFFPFLILQPSWNRIWIFLMSFSWNSDCSLPGFPGNYPLSDPHTCTGGLAIDVGEIQVSYAQWRGGLQKANPSLLQEKVTPSF